MNKFLIRMSLAIVLSVTSGFAFTFGQLYAFKLIKDRARREERLREIRKNREENLKYYGERRVDFDHPSNTPHHN